MISQRQKNWSIYSIVSTFVFFLIAVIGVYNSYENATESGIHKMFIANWIVIGLIPIVGTWITYAIIYQNEKIKLNKRVERIKKSKVVGIEYKPKLDALERLLIGGRIESDKYYSHLNKLVESAEKSINIVDTGKKLEAIYATKESQLKDSYKAGLINQKELDYRLNLLNSKRK